MKISKIRIICLLLAAIMVASLLLSSCGDANEVVESGVESETNENSESSSESQTESGNETETGGDGEVETEPLYKIEGEFGSSILEADRLKGEVKAYFRSGIRDNLIVENGRVNMDVGLSLDKDGVVTISNKQGGVFLDATIDSYIKTEDGKYYYASNSIGSSDANIYRLGYYMYDVHVYGGDFFTDSSEFVEARPIFLNMLYKTEMCEQIEGEDGVYAYKITDPSDPRVYMQPKKLDADNTKYFRFSVKSTST